MHGPRQGGRMHGAEEHDGIAHADSAQLETLGDGGDAVAERPGRAQCRHDALDTEAVAAGLDHGDDRDRAAGRRADSFQVARDGRRADFHPGALA